MQTLKPTQSFLFWMSYTAKLNWQNGLWIFVCACMCECACVGTPDALLLRGIYCVSRCFELQHTHRASSCQAITESLLSGCAFRRPDNVFFFFFNLFFVWSENDIIKYEWEIWLVPLQSMSARSRWCGKDNSSPDRGTQLGRWGPDGLLTTGNHSKHADTLTSTQMAYQNYPEHLGCVIIPPPPFQSLGCPDSTVAVQ